MATFKDGKLGATVEVVACRCYCIGLAQVRCGTLGLMNGLTFQRVFGRRTARCSFGRGVVGGDSRVHWARDEAMVRR